MSKKTVKLIVERGNDYLICVKGNQKGLYQQIQANTCQSLPSSIDITHERTRTRTTQRSVSVFDNLDGISSEWLGLRSLIQVERKGTRDGKPYHQLSYYISSLPLCAAQFAAAIRAHWGIENRLHWVKDVVLAEDKSPIRQQQACANLSIVRTMVINILRCHGYAGVTKAQRLIAHDLDQIFCLLQ